MTGRWICCRFFAERRRLFSGFPENHEKVGNAAEKSSMIIIHAYITRMFFKYFGMVLGMVTVVYLSIDFFGRIDKLIALALGPSDIVAYFLYKIPLIISQILPAALLLGVLSVFTLMVKNNEIVALKSGGISVLNLIKPMVYIGLLLSVVLFIFSEAVVPVSNSKVSEIIDPDTGERRMMTSRDRNIWIRGDQSIIHIAHYDPAGPVVYGVILIYFDPDFAMNRRIDAKRGEYTREGWRLHEVMVQNFDHTDDQHAVRIHDRLAVDLDFRPEDLLQVVRESEEMNFWALLNYIRKIEREGYDATRYRVDLHAKAAFPWVCLIMALVGSGIALRGRTRDSGLAAGFAYGIATAFLYWGCYSFCLSLGYGNLLPPPAAAWAANVLFLGIAGLLILSLD
jgi:lipopolysaccharide export system permease protein